MTCRRLAARRVGERTRGGAHAREGFRVHPHLEATFQWPERSVHHWRNWEGVGVAPDIEVAAEAAFDRAFQLAVTASLSATP